MDALIYFNILFYSYIPMTISHFCVIVIVHRGQPSYFWNSHPKILGMKKTIDFIDLKNVMGESHNNFISDLGYTQMQIA